MSQKRAPRKLPSWMTHLTKVHANANNGLQMKEKTNPPLIFQGTIKYCPTIDDMGLACETLISEADKRDELILGFDAEWPFDFQKGSSKVALIQVCPDESICYLFHVSCIGCLPKIFQILIQHPKVRLVGNCIKNDIWKLGKDFNIPVAKLVGSGHVIDLGELANEVLCCAQTWSLDRLALHLMSGIVDKTDSIRKSRWDLELSIEQQSYAATDAYVSLAIYNKLKAIQKSSLQNPIKILVK